MDSRRGSNEILYSVCKLGLLGKKLDVCIIKMTNSEIMYCILLRIYKKPILHMTVNCNVASILYTKSETNQQHDGLIR